MRNLAATIAVLSLTSLPAACTHDAPALCQSDLRIEGAADARALVGSASDECLFGTAGADKLDGQGGNDLLVGGAGTDLLDGGGGDDRYFVELGDGLDLLSDSDGVDSLQFGEGITPELLAVRRDEGAFYVQVDNGEDWTYLVIAPGNDGGTPIERYVFADQRTLTHAELLAQVSQQALPVGEFNAMIVERATVIVGSPATDDELLRAARDTLRASYPEALCLSPPRQPAPHAMGKTSGNFGPSEYFATFHGAPPDAYAERQRAQFRALAAVGIFHELPVSGADGDTGVRFELTWDGWGYFDQQGCLHYGRRIVKSVDEYIETGRATDGGELVIAKVTVAATDVPLWARQQIVADAFPELAADIAGRTLELVLIRNGGDWLPTFQGKAMRSVAQAMGNLPTDKDILAAEDPFNPGTLGDAAMCIALPLLGHGNLDDPQSPYVTYTRYPFVGGNLERREEDKAFLDMLVRFGVATQGFRYETDGRGRTNRLIEYRIVPEATVINGSGRHHRCLEVGRYSFEVLQSRWLRGNSLVVRGRRTATPGYAWVLSPEFLAQHPDFSPLFANGAPAVARIDVIPDRPLRVSSIWP